MPVEEYCDHNYCSHRDCSDIDCSHCAIWLLPQQLKDQVSEIVEVLNRSYTCFTARTSTEMHSSLPELKEQLLSLMSDHFHNITILMNKLGRHHPIVLEQNQQHSSLESQVANFVDMVRLGDLHKEIEDILARTTALLSAKKEPDMHSKVHDIKDQLLSHMSDHSHAITFLTNQLGEEHPTIVLAKLDHASLEVTVNKLLEAVEHVQPTVALTKPGQVVPGSDSAQPEEFQLPAPPASAQGPDVLAITAATKRTIKTLKDLTSEITEVMDTIHINIDLQRAEL